jgi:hypothetical protein
VPPDVRAGRGDLRALARERVRPVLAEVDGSVAREREDLPDADRLGDRDERDVVRRPSGAGRGAGDAVPDAG